MCRHSTVERRTEAVEGGRGNSVGRVLLVLLAILVIAEADRSRASEQSDSAAVPERRAVFRAGFDCALAATPVEHAICGNELIARGDFEASELYRELRNALPEDQALELRTGQRAWLRLRNDRCTSGEAADETCLARLYGDRLVALARLKDPHLGDGDGFDSAYALARIVRGADLRDDTAARLAMYPLAMDPAGETDWRADPAGLLFDQAYVETRTVWPGEVDFRYSDLLYVGRDGTVWTVEHVDTTAPPPPDSGIRADRLWAEAGRDPLTIRSEAGPDAPYPPPVARWLDERGVAVPARPGVVDVCGRTPQVRDEIVRATGVANCEAVTGGDLPGVDVLHLRRTDIETLQEGDFAGLSGLESLDLRDNGLTVLPPQIFAGLSSLRSLDLDRNDVAALPEAVFAGLPSLRSLGLGDNRLTALSEGVFVGLTNLESLRLGDNPLATLSEGVFAGLTNLESLRVSRIELTRLLPGVFAGLSNLEALHLYGNNLATLPAGAFAGLSSLKSLDLGGNALTALQEGVFDGLSGLEELRLASTGLTRLPQGVFAGLAGLQRLDLRDNALTMLSAEVFAGLSSLRSLDVGDNPGSPFELSLGRTDSWCTVQQAAFINFQRNGDTVSICEDEGTLTYFMGRLDAEPELRYSGSVLASLGGASVNAGEVPYRNLADLAGWSDDPEERGLLKELACATTTNGFIEIGGLTGYFSSTVYVFRNGGWQYEVGGEWGRTINVPEGTDEYEELASHEVYSLTARSPEEQDHCLD